MGGGISQYRLARRRPAWAVVTVLLLVIEALPATARILAAASGCYGRTAEWV